MSRRSLVLRSGAGERSVPPWKTQDWGRLASTVTLSDPSYRDLSGAGARYTRLKDRSAEASRLSTGSAGPPARWSLAFPLASCLPAGTASVRAVPRVGAQPCWPNIWPVSSLRTNRGSVHRACKAINSFVMYRAARSVSLKVLRVARGRIADPAVGIG